MKELVELHYDEYYTFGYTQLPVENWVNVIGNEALEEAIWDTVTATFYILRLEEENLDKRILARS